MYGWLGVSRVNTTTPTDAPSTMTGAAKTLCTGQRPRCWSNSGRSERRNQSCGKCGQSIRELRVRRETGALIIAIQSPDGTFDATPNPDTKLDAGDVVIAVGTDDELRLLEDLFRPQEPVA